MAYSSLRGRKPLERASKISHANVINNPQVQEFINQCAVPQAAEQAVLAELLQDVPPLTEPRVRAVVAVDGSFREVSIRDDFPSSAVTFFAFGPLLFRLEELRKLDKQAFIAPEDLARLKNIQRYSLVLPTRNISRAGKSLTDSVRSTLHDFFATSHGGDKPLVGALRWVIFRGWVSNGEKRWEIPSCPNAGCDRSPVVLTPTAPDVQDCSSCGGPIYMIDAFRLHERIDEDQGASGITSYVMTLLEQLVLVHVIKALWELKPAFLREILFIKDGPLAFFGQTAPLSKPMRELASFLGKQRDPSGGSMPVSLFNAVGLEKSGPFVEHAVQIEAKMQPGTALLLANDYIYKYIIPGDPHGPDPYGKNTYWGGKLIYKARDNNVYVATIPTHGFTPKPRYDDFLNLSDALAVLGELRCSMYDNALIPIALANRLVSLSDFPSKRILEVFAREGVKARS
jgi:NurA domain